MFPRRFLIVGVAAIVILGLVLTGSAAHQRDAWTQGYLVGRLSAGGSGSGAAAPLPPEVYPGLGGGYGYGAYGGYGGYGGGPHFGGFGVLLLIGLGFLFFMGAGRFFRRCAGGGWGHHGHWQGPYGGNPAEGSPEQGGPSAGARAQGGPWQGHPWHGGPWGGGPWQGGPSKWQTQPGGPTPNQNPEQPPAGGPEQTGFDPGSDPGPIGRRWYA
jgi:hypothetical protein